VALAYSLDSRWRNRSEFVTGRPDIIAFLTRKWTKELDYRLIKELWAFGGNRIAVRFAYEWHDDSGNWYRSYGNENWEIQRGWPHAAEVRNAEVYFCFSSETELVLIPRSIEESLTGSGIDGEDTLSFSVLSNIRPMIETVPLEQAKHASPWCWSPVNRKQRSK